MSHRKEEPLLVPVNFEEKKLAKIFPECLVHSLIALLGDSVPDLSSANTDKEENLPEVIKEIDRVVIATQSPKKCAALLRLFHDYLAVVKGPAKIQLNKIDVPGNEPDWTNAIAVAWHKVWAVVEELKSTQCIEDKSGNALVVGSDIVAYVNGKPFHNLSRIKQEKGKLDGEDLAKQLEVLKGAYSNGESVIAYDIAIAMSAKSKNGQKVFKVATGVRLELKLDQVPEEVVEHVFGNKKPAVFNINTGLPFVDPKSELNCYVRGYTVAPLSAFTDYSNSENRHGLIPAQLEFPPEIADVAYFQYVDFGLLDDQEKEEHLNYIRLMVMGGLPPNVNNLLQQQLIKANGNPLKVV